MPCIDFDNLFEYGETDIFYIDKEEIREKVKDISIHSLRELHRTRSATVEGRQELLNRFDKKDMQDKLKDLGMRHKELSKDEMKKILEDVWVELGDY